MKNEIASISTSPFYRKIEGVIIQEISESYQKKKLARRTQSLELQQLILEENELKSTKKPPSESN